MAHIMTKNEIISTFNKIENAGLESPEAQALLNNLFDAHTKEHETPLHFAIQGNKLKLAETLFMNGRPKLAYAKDGSGLTPLHYAVKEGHTKLVNLFIENIDSEMIYERDARGNTLLHTAVMQGKIDTVELLIEKGGQRLLFMQTSNGDTALHTAVENNREEILDLLLTKGGETLTLVADNNGDTALHFAAKDKADMAVLLLNTGGAKLATSTNNLQFSALHYAAREGRENIIKHLLNTAGHTLVFMQEFTGWTALQLAAKNGHLKAANLLLEQDTTHASIRNHDGKIALDIATSFNKKEVASLLHPLSEKNSKPAQVNKTRIMSENEIKSVFKKIEEAGLISPESEALLGNLINAHTREGETPLHFAAKGNHLKLARALLKKGGDRLACAKNNSGLTALHNAVENGNSVLTSMLLDIDSEMIYARKTKGYTLLHTAVLQGNIDMVRLLVERGGPRLLFMQASDGNTALHTAAETKTNAEEITDILLAKGGEALSLVKNDQRKTALHVATQAGKTDVAVSLLKTGGAKLATAKSDQELTALHIAAKSGSKNIVIPLLATAGKTLVPIQQAEGLTALHVAVSSGYADIATLILEVDTAHARIKTNDGNTALHLSQNNGRKNTSILLANMGGKDLVIMKNAIGDTALHSAVRADDLPLAEALIAQGGNELILAKNKEGETALHMAFNFHRIEIAKLIIKQGKSEAVTAKNKYDETALHLSVIQGLTEITKSILEYDGKNLVLAKNVRGETALHHACQYDRKDEFEALMAVGGSALANIRANNNDRALDVARNRILIEICHSPGPDSIVKFDYMATILLKYAGGKSVASKPPYNAKSGGIAIPNHSDFPTYLDLDKIPYTLEGYLNDPDKDVLLLNAKSNLFALYRDLENERGIQHLPDAEKLYLYALAFECHAKRVLPADNPDLTLMSKFIPLFSADKTSEFFKNTVLTAIRGTQAAIKLKDRYKLGKRFQRSEATIFDAIPVVVAPPVQAMAVRKPAAVPVNESVTRGQDIMLASEADDSANEPLLADGGKRSKSKSWGWGRNKYSRL